MDNNNYLSEVLASTGDRIVSRASGDSNQLKGEEKLAFNKLKAILPDENGISDPTLSVRYSLLSREVAQAELRKLLYLQTQPAIQTTDFRSLTDKKCIRALEDNQNLETSNIELLAEESLAATGIDPTTFESKFNREVHNFPCTIPCFFNPVMSSSNTPESLPEQEELDERSQQVASRSPSPEHQHAAGTDRGDIEMLRELADRNLSSCDSLTETDEEDQKQRIRFLEEQEERGRRTGAKSKVQFHKESPKKSSKKVQQKNPEPPGESDDRDLEQSLYSGLQVASELIGHPLDLEDYGTLPDHLAAFKTDPWATGLVLGLFKQLEIMSQQQNQLVGAISDLSGTVLDLTQSIANLEQRLTSEAVPAGSELRPLDRKITEILTWTVKYGTDLSRISQKVDHLSRPPRRSPCTSRQESPEARSQSPACTRCSPTRYLNQVRHFRSRQYYPCLRSPRLL